MAFEIRRLALTVIAAASLATPAAAELATWDQARVTGIAKQLASACDAFQQAAQRQQGGTLGSGDAGSVFGMQRETRALCEQSRALAGHLAAGKGQEPTRDEYRGLKEMADDIEEEAQRSSLDEPTMDALGEGRRPAAPDRALLRREGELTAAA